MDDLENYLITYIPKDEKLMSRSIEKYVEIIKRTKDLSQELEIEYIKKAKSRSKYRMRYKTLLFEAHFKLVLAIARRYAIHNETLEDLVQEGVKGLEHALVLFDLKKRVRFNTYARHWIRAYIIKYFSDNVRGFRVPSEISARLCTINAAIEKLSKKLLREPTSREIANHLSYEPDYVDFLRKYLLPNVSLSMPSNHSSNTHNDTSYGDTLVDNHRDNARESLSRVDGVRQIKEAIDALPEIERFIIYNRYGLGDCDEQTLSEVGKRLGLSAERVRQVQLISENKLKKIMNK